MQYLPRGFRTAVVSLQRKKTIWFWIIPIELYYVFIQKLNKGLQLSYTPLQILKIHNKRNFPPLKLHPLLVRRNKVTHRRTAWRWKSWSWKSEGWRRRIWRTPWWWGWWEEESPSWENWRKKRGTFTFIGIIFSI